MRKIINHWLKWTVLSDNRSDDSRLSTEHGLSIFLQTTNEREQCDACINIAERGEARRSQTERYKILLDTGASLRRRICGSLVFFNHRHIRLFPREDATFKVHTLIADICQLSCCIGRAATTAAIDGNRLIFW